MVKVEHSNPEHLNWFVVNWCLGNTCTYSCSYCPKGLHDGSVPWPDYETVHKFVCQMKAHAESLGKKLCMELTGGEVTVWKDFTRIAEFCHAEGIKLLFISNGSRTLRWWAEHKHLFDHVCLSFHPEEADPDHFVSVVQELSRTLRTHVNIMMEPSRFDYCYAVAERVVAVGNISIALQPLIHDFGSVLFDYTEEQKKVFDEQHQLVTKIKWERSFPYYRGAMRKIDADGASVVWAAHRFINHQQNNWAGWDCYSGVEQIIVDMDGTIFRGWCKVGGSLGTIHDPKFTSAPVVCNKTMCHCNYDIMSTKIKRAHTLTPRVIPIHEA